MIYRIKGSYNYYFYLFIDFIQLLTVPVVYIGNYYMILFVTTPEKQICHTLCLRKHFMSTTGILISTAPRIVVGFPRLTVVGSI